MTKNSVDSNSAKLTREQVSKLAAGTKVYRIQDVHIVPFWVIGLHPKSKTTLVMGHGGSVANVETYHVNSNFAAEVWTEDYEIAKETMWQQHLERGKSIRKIYFKDE